MSPEMEANLTSYLAARRDMEAERVESTLAAMNPRERKLVREAAVMGYVRGSMAGAVDARAGRETVIPPDSQVLRHVTECCLSMPDLYPTFERMERTANRRAAREPEGGDR